MFGAPTFLLLFLSVEGSASTNLRTGLFNSETICSVEDRKQRGCSKEVGHVRSFLACVARCELDDSCIGASEDEAGRCFHHQTCLPSVSCGQPDAGHRYVARDRPCVHGTWSSSTETCVCTEGTSGDLCDSYPTDCSGLLSAGYPNGTYQIIIDPKRNGVDLMKVYCSIRLPSDLQLHLARNQGFGGFNRTWQEYVDGFHVDANNYWLGLRHWHVLTNSRCSTVVSVLKFKSGSFLYLTYDDIDVADDTNDYLITWDGSFTRSEGTVPAGIGDFDCTDDRDTMCFSTWDRQHTIDCVCKTGNGWWYHSEDCNGPCNLLGYLDDYFGKPPEQRLCWPCVDMDHLHSQVEETFVYAECDD